MEDAIPFKRVRIRPDDPQSNDEGPEGSDRSGGPEATVGADTPDSPGKIRGRIRKLLATGLHPRTGKQEADAALALARDLLTKHKLAVEEVFAGDVEPDPPAPNLWPAPVDGKALIADLLRLLRRHIVMTPEQATAVALWTFHAHCHDAAEHSPLLMITAPTLMCGKSELLRFVSYLVPRPSRTENATLAAIYSEIERSGATILIDEGETFLTSAQNKELQGILNSGHLRDGYITRKDRRYSTWAPKAVALNGRLDPTTESRSIIVKLTRKREDETVDRLTRPKDGDDDNPFNVMRRKLARWAADHLETLREADPELPAELVDRDADNWRPLIAIADLAGYPNKARNAARAIMGQRLRKPQYGVRLLADLKTLFARHGSPLASTQIVDELNAMEDRPWRTYMRGSSMMPVHLADLLEPFDIKPGEVKTATGRRAQGYRIQQFTDAFARYAK